ncbi:MAG: hypothetical protein ACRCR2_02095 [Fusobacteriaceae bacterium]
MDIEERVNGKKGRKDKKTSEAGKEAGKIKNVIKYKRIKKKGEVLNMGKKEKKRNK